MLRKILLALVVLIAGFVAFVATRPAEFRVERSARVAAPPAVVFDQIDDFTAWQQWNPWQKLDPAQKTTLEGPATGVGAAYSWEGNDQVGKGRMEILEVTPGEKVVWSLHFIAPWEATNKVEISVAPDGEGSKVRWLMTGTNDFMSKEFGVFMDMDEMVGADFEQGLKNLDAVSQAAAKASPAAS